MINFSKLHIILFNIDKRREKVWY